MQDDVTNSIAAFAAVVAAISAIASMFSAIASWRQVRLMKEESDKRERPFLYGYFHSVHGAIVRFSLENKGNVAALNARAHFEEPAPIRFDDTSLNSAALFSNTIAFFPPGQRYTVDVHVAQAVFADGKPTEFKLILSYESPGGHKLNDSIAFDITYLRSVLDPPPTAAEAVAKLKEPLDKISSAMQAWRREEQSAKVAEKPKAGGGGGKVGGDG